MKLFNILRKMVPVAVFVLVAIFLNNSVSAVTQDVAVVSSPTSVTPVVTQVNATNAGIPQITIETLIANILNIVYAAIGIVSIIVIIIAGFTMVTSGYNPSSVAKARNAILFAGIGIIVSIAAFAITQFIIGRF